MTGTDRIATIHEQHDCAALNKWIIGHQGMFVLQRELHRGLMHLQAAIQSKDGQAALRHFTRVNTITRACAVSFKLTGDLHGSDYDGRIVPAMVATHQNFTGLWSRDHSAMRQQLVRTFSKLDGFAAERSHLKLVTAIMVQQHELVCEQFAHGRPSLNAIGNGLGTAEQPGYIKLREEFGPVHVKSIDRRARSSDRKS